MICKIWWKTTGHRDFTNLADMGSVSTCDFDFFGLCHKCNLFQPANTTAQPERQPLLRLQVGQYGQSYFGSHKPSLDPPFYKLQQGNELIIFDDSPRSKMVLIWETQTYEVWGFFVNWWQVSIYGETVSLLVRPFLINISVCWTKEKW